MNINVYNFNTTTKDQSLYISIPRIENKFKSIDNAPIIIRRLGQKIQTNTNLVLADKTNIISTKTKNKEVSKKLHSLLYKISELVQKNYLEDSSSISQEIQTLEGEVQQLENEFGLLPNKEQKILFGITKDLHKVLSYSEEWLLFQERYYSIDDQLSVSLEAIQKSLYSDLHGWSLTSAEGAMKSLALLKILIDMTTPILQQNGVFTPEILSQLASSVRSGSWECTDWIHNITSQYNHVLSVTKEQWNQACLRVETNQSIEAYTNLHLAAKQLLSMKHVFAELEKFLPNSQDFASLAKKIDKEMQLESLSDEEYAFKKNIRNDLKLLEDAVHDAKQFVTNKSNNLDKVIQNTHFEEKLSQAKKTLSGQDLKPYIKNIRKKYESGEKTLECYLKAKRELSGLQALPNTEKAYEEEFAFCLIEEQRFSELEGYSIDFDELIQIQMMKLAQPQPGIFSRIWQALPDPAQWSDSTKEWVHVSFLGLQLIDQVAKMLPQTTPTLRAEPSLSQEDAEILSREVAFLGATFTKKIEHLKDPATLDNLTRKALEIKPVLAALTRHYVEMPPLKEQRSIMDRYETYRKEVLLSGKSDKTFDWIVQPKPGIEGPLSSFRAVQIKSPTAFLTDTNNQRVIVKTEASALPSIVATGPFISSFSAIPEIISLGAIKQNAIEDLKEAATDATALDQRLRQCSRTEFLKPGLPVTPHALLLLRNDLAILRHALSDTMENKPSGDLTTPEWIDWNLEVQQQCNSLKELEGRIAEGMSAYEEAAAMNDYKSYASLDLFGNKHKNLIKQYDIAIALGIQGLEVPMPQGIASQKVMKFLTAYAPKIFGHWKQIEEIYAFDEGKDPILENEEVLTHLKAIDQGITEAFTIASNDEVAFTKLGFSKEMRDWLVKLSKDNKFLMVRSTGAEDSKKSANAGGNASISYVKPNQEELCKALGEVVRSYFSVGSLQKRLNANLNPFEDELKVAVTTQELIGEPLGGAKDPNQIPVSVVLFTSEPLFIGDEKFRAMRISATYGHGEGVVGNQGIASDTALVMISVSDPSKLYILYDNQEKSERLAPVRDETSGSISLQKIANSKEIAQKPALNNALIARLYEWGVIGEKYFEDYPTDMEIVVKGDTIYPVQARPINRPKLFASYVDLKKMSGLSSSPIEKTLLAEMIVPGKGSVVEITKPEEILIVETLEKAEGLFKKGQHKLVVVGKQEPSNSHPVVNFSALGMPCLYVKNLDDIQNVVKEISTINHLAVCVQSATVSLWNVAKGSVQDYTSKGFVVHPAKIAISLEFNDPLAKREGIFVEAPKEIVNLLTQLGSAGNNKEALAYFKALKSEKWIADLEFKISELEDKTAKQPLFEKSTRPVIEAAKSLKTKIYAALLQIEALLNNPTESGRLELLMHLKVLQTLLFQSPSSPGAIAQHSRLSIEESFVAANAMMLYQSQLSHPAHFADILMDGSQSPVEEVFNEWQAFLLKLEPLAEKTLNGEASGLTLTEMSCFKTVLHTLRQAEVLPLFMTFFLEQVSDSNNAIEILQSVVNLLPSKDEPLIEMIFVKKKKSSNCEMTSAKLEIPKPIRKCLVDCRVQFIVSFQPTTIGCKRMNGNQLHP